MHHRLADDGRLLPCDARRAASRSARAAGASRSAVASASDFDRNSRARATVAADFRRTYPMLADVPITHDWCGPIDRTPNSLPVMGRLGGRPHIVYGVGWSGNGVGPSVVGGKVLASLVARAGRRLEPASARRPVRRPLSARADPMDRRAHRARRGRAQGARGGRGTKALVESTSRSRASRPPGSRTRPPMTEQAAAAELSHLAGSPPRGGTDVRVLRDGLEAFPAMMEAMAAREGASASRTSSSPATRPAAASPKRSPGPRGGASTSRCSTTRSAR